MRLNYAASNMLLHYYIVINVQIMDIRTSLFIIFCLTCATNAEPVPGKAAEDSKVSRYVPYSAYRASSKWLVIWKVAELIP